ncbi:exopolysaccharide biosynthesis polyprenyl glycosylphosphotransferase [Flavobacteriaceae bacterium]|nr:exopolysaccharide biosynthesis polyprenyl glycosylphosphotransferase [Flavobacteriaceae bacterium]
MKNSRFNTYFPILYYTGEFFVIFLSTQIMLTFTFTKWTFLNSLFIGFWFLISLTSKSHVIGRDISKFNLVKSSLRSLFLFSGFISILNLLFFRQEFYLLTIILAANIFYFLMLLYRLTLDSILEKYRATGGNILKCLVIVHDSHGDQLYNEILKHPELGYRCSGVYTYKKTKKNIISVPYLGTFDKLDSEIISNYDRIFFSQKLKTKYQEKIIGKADSLNIKVSSIPELAFYDYKNFFISKISTVPYVSINSLPLDNLFNILIKRSFDIIFSLLVTVFILSWMIPVFGLVIKLGTKGPIFFIQKREGYKGNYFGCLKFRTMVINSHSDTKWADDDDKRLTRFGKFLRLSTLDEMPQFINVLLGDMSVVGPRPHPVNLNKEYNKLIKGFNKRHRFKPGITGLAQSKGYSGFISSYNDMRDRVKIDIFYFKNWSIILDFKIVILTALKVFLGLKSIYKL